MSRLRLRVGGVPEHFNLPWHRLAESGALQAAGIELVWTDYPTGTGAMLGDLADGRLDVANLLTEGVALGMARGLPIEAVSLYTSTPLIWGIHVAPASHIGSIAELRGKRFAISRPGSGSHLMSLALAAEQSWDSTEIDFEVVENIHGAERALAAGTADVFLWEHFTTEPWVERGVFRRIDDFVAPWPAWVICANSAVAQESNLDIAQLVDKLAGTATELAASTDAASQFAKAYELREDAVRRWLGRTEWTTGMTNPAAALELARDMLRVAGQI